MKTITTHLPTRLDKDIYPGVPLKMGLHFALIQFYPSKAVLELSGFSKQPPKEWNPIYFHYYNGEFDPYLMGQADTDHKGELLFTPWKDATGVEKAISYAKAVKAKINEYDYYKTRVLSETGGSNLEIDALLSTRFIWTKEQLTENSIILGVYNIAEDVYSRYLIKDLKKVCSTLRFFDGDFYRVLGATAMVDTTYNSDMLDEQAIEELNSFIENVSNTEILDPCVKAMMAEIKTTSAKVYYISKAI